MGIEEDTKSPWNEGHIGTGRGYDGVTDSSIGQVGYNDAQCAVNIGSLGYNYYRVTRSLVARKSLANTDLRVFI